MPNKLSQFWQELKRRKVLKVIAMYAGAAYILIELANNVVEPLSLPGWTPRLIILIVLMGFPLTAFLSWIFDFTPEGLIKAESIEEESGAGLLPPAEKRKLKASDLIIAVLVILVGILVYPKIFPGKAGLNAMTRRVTVTNEFGEKENRKVFRGEFITRLVLFPFMNESSDLLNDWMEFGIPDAIYQDLLQFNYVLVSHYGVASHLQEQIDYAKANNFSYFLTGTYNLVNGLHEISCQLYRSDAGRLVNEKVFRGNDLFSLIDSISLQSRTDLGISGKVINSFPDLPVAEQFTNNLDAFRHYELGNMNYLAWQQDLPRTGSFFVHFSTAIELDSTFALAAWKHAYYNDLYHRSRASAHRFINLAMRHCSRLSEVSELQIRTLYYLIQGENSRAVSLAKLQCDLQPYNINLLKELISVYQRSFMIEEVERATERLNRLAPDLPDYQLQLALSYLFTGAFNRGLRVLKRILRDNPENTDALMQMGELYLHNNDLEAAEETFRKAILLSPENEESWSLILDHISYLRNNPVTRDFLEQFAGKYRFEQASGVAHENFIHNNHLFDKAAHQRGMFLYPVSDSVFTFLSGRGTKTFYVDHRNRFTKIVHRQYNLDDLLFNWIEDSLISGALNALQNENYPEAPGLFKAAYDRNPEHYYLANFIQHLEFIGGCTHEEVVSAMEPLLGDYGTLRLYMQNGHYYFVDTTRGFIHELLPLNTCKLMSPNLYFLTVQIEFDNDSVIGLKFITRDGEEEFHPRNEPR